MPPIHEKLRIREKIAYSFGDIASNLFFKSFLVYLMFFYTDVFGIPAGIVATLFLVTRIWDAIFDPMMGIIADRTNTRYGRFRPYMLWCSIPYAIIGILTYTTPELSQNGRIIWAWVTYTLMMMIYSAINIPYSALVGVITADPDERTSLSGYRMAGANIAGMGVEGFTLILVAALGAGSQQVGFQRTFILYGLLSVILWYLCFKWTKERVAPVTEHKSSIGRDLLDLLSNGPWLALCVISILSITAVAIRLGIQMYYFKYYLSCENLGPWFMATGSLAWIFGALSADKFTKLLGCKRRTFLVFMILNGLLTLAFMKLGKGDIGLIYALNILAGFTAGPTSPLIWSMYADAADYSEWKRGRRATGLVISAGVFAQKCGWAVGPAIGGWLLDHYGFKANVEQNAETLRAIVLMMAIIPGVGTILAGLCIYLYPVSSALLSRIGEDLRLRRASLPESTGPRP